MKNGKLEVSQSCTIWEVIQKESLPTFLWHREDKWLLRSSSSGQSPQPGPEALNSSLSHLDGLQAPSSPSCLNTTLTLQKHEAQSLHTCMRTPASLLIYRATLADWNKQHEQACKELSALAYYLSILKSARSHQFDEYVHVERAVRCSRLSTGLRVTKDSYSGNKVECRALQAAGFYPFLDSSENLLLTLENAAKKA